MTRIANLLTLIGVNSAAHAVFLAVILGLLTHNGEAVARVDWRSVWIGCGWVLAFLAVSLVVDLVRLRHWSFWHVEQATNRGLGRVIVVLETLYAVGSVLPQYVPATAPRWLSSLMNRLPNVHPGRRFEDYWADERADEA